MHGLSTRDDGPVTGPVRARIVETLGGDPQRIVAPVQVHGRVVRHVLGHDRDERSEADGVATAERDLTLMVQGADCPLVLLLDPDRPALALVHSGWRGSVAGIAREGVTALAPDGEASRLLAAIFPGIGPCCYEVGEELRAAFGDAFGARAAAWFRRGPRGRDHLDLRAAITATLTGAGVARDRIDVVPGCTACGGLLFSHRASGGSPDRHGLFARLV